MKIWISLAILATIAEHKRSQVPRSGGQCSGMTPERTA
jgi:hypothetical protein